MYRVIKEFADIRDKGYIYKIGDVYPRIGHTETTDRVEELSSSKNKLGVPLIEDTGSKRSNGGKKSK